MSDPNKTPAFLKALDTIQDLIAKFCVILAGIALVVMTVIFAWLVFGRYVLNNTPTWVEQVSLLLVMLIAFVGASVGVRENSHLSVVLFRGWVSKKTRTVLVIITDTIMAIFGGVLLIYGVELTKFKWSAMIPLIQVSEGWRSLPLAICGGLVLLFSLGHLIRVLMGRDLRVDSID